MIALVSDIHIGMNNFSKSVFEEQMLFFEKQFFPYLIDNQIKHVIHTGDFFHNRNIIDWFIFNEVKIRFFGWFEKNQITFHTIVGNHDSYFRNTIDQNSLDNIVKEFDFVKVYSSVTTVKIDRYHVGMIPWIVDDITFPVDVDFLCCHMDLKGFPMVQGISSKDGFDVAIFKRYKYVFSGHYHMKYNKDNVYMIGSQYQRSWNDFNEDKGFYVIGDNFDLIYVENTVNAKFVKIKYDAGIISQNGLNNLDEIISTECAVEIAKTNYTKIYMNHTDSQSQFDAFHMSLQSVAYNNHSIEVVDVKDMVDDTNCVDCGEDVNTIDMMLNIISDMTFPKNIDLNTLLNMTKEVYKEAMYEGCDG